LTDHYSHETFYYCQEFNDIKAQQCNHSIKTKVQ
jgi:hypothetical protein